jgi:hypothetical protein
MPVLGQGSIAITKANNNHKATAQPRTERRTS